MRRTRKTWLVTGTVAVFAASTGTWAGTAMSATPKPSETKGSVAVSTTTGSSGEIVGPTAESVSITLADPTFTQRAGQAILVAGEATLLQGPDQGVQTCDLTVDVVAAGAPLGFELVQLARRGDPTLLLGDSQALPTAAADRSITLSAQVTVSDAGQTEFTCDPNETFSVSLRISVIKMPS